MTFKELGLGTRHPELAQHDVKAGPEALSQEGFVMGGAGVPCSPVPPLPAATCAWEEFGCGCHRAPVRKA